MLNSAMHTSEEQAKLEIQAIIDQLNSEVQDIIDSGEKERLDYLLPGLAKVNSMMLDSDQFIMDVDPDSEGVLVERLVKIRRYANKAELEYYGIDFVLSAGFFVVVPMYLLPAKKVRKAMRNRWRGVLYPEKFGLPSNELVDYATIKPLSATTYTAVAKFKGSYANNLITTARHYDNVVAGE